MRAHARRLSAAFADFLAAHLKKEALEVPFEHFFVDAAYPTAQNLPVDANVEGYRVGGYLKAGGEIAFGVEGVGKSDAILFNEFQNVRARVLDGDAEEVDAALIDLVRALQTWSFLFTGKSPGRPEI